MGANKLTLPTQKILVASLQETAAPLAILVKASSGRKPGIRIPATIAGTMKNFPKLVTWFEKNRAAYDAFVASLETGATTTRTRGAGG